MTEPRHQSHVVASFEEDGFLRAVVDTIVDAIVTIDARGIIQHANPATERLFGYPVKEVVGRNVSMLMPSPFRDEHDGYLARYLQSREARIIGIGRQVVGKKRDGTLIPMDLAVSEVTVAGQTYFTGVVRDISERVHAEEQIRKERDFSRSLIDTAHAVILVLDPQGGIVRINPYMEHLVGYTLDEVSGRDWFDLFILDEDREQLRDLFHQTLSGTPVTGNVNSIRTRLGEHRTITWSARRLLNPDGDVVGLLSVGNDITDLKNAERRLVQSERLAAVGEVMTGLAHESRNALQRTQACLEMLELDINEREHTDLIHRAKRALTELQRLYEEVRSYAAPIKLDRREYQLSSLIADVWQSIQQVTSPSGVELEIDCDRRVDQLVGDADRVQQVFRNILENALAVSPRPGTVHVRSTRAALDGRPCVAIHVWDEGAGLSPEQMAHMLDPFYTTKVRGTGLGLAIAQRVVEAHRGTLVVGNHADGGAELVVTLPIES